jgi:hypothetical protein
VTDAFVSLAGYVAQPARRNPRICMKLLRFICLSAEVVATVLAAGQQTVTLPATGSPGLDRYRASRIAIYLNDYGELSRYRAANAALKAPAPGENRVVFFGDSITDMGNPRSRTSIAASAARPARRCWFVFARM